MPETRTVPTSASPDVCTFKVLSEGTELPEAYHVLSVVVTREVNRIPTATLVLLDGEAAQETFPISDEPVLIPGKEIEIKAGYRGQNDTIFWGTVIRHSIKIRKDTSFLTVECKDPAVRMTVGERSHYYHDQKDSDIIEDLLGRYDLQKEVEPTDLRHPQLVQFHTTDWDFLVSRADLNGKLCVVEDGKVTVKKPNLDQDPVLTLQYGATILELDAEIDPRLQYKAVKAQAWDPANQELTTAEAREPSLSLPGNLSATDLAKVTGTEGFLLPHSGQVPEPELRNRANAKLLKHRLAKVRGRVRCQGIPELKPGTVLELKGVGDRFQGEAFVSGVRHQIANGNWEADVQLGLDPRWFTHTLPNAGTRLPFPAMAGLQVGVVTQLENDPAGEDRILVRLPVVSEQDEGVWARQATLDAGENRGTFFRPEVGDEVIVGFLDNDPTQAVVLGMVHSSAKPTPEPAKDDNHEKGYVSRSEMKVIFNDDKKTMTFSTPAGNTLLLSEDEKMIQLEDQHGNKITLDQDGIKLESIKEIFLKAATDAKVEAISITAKADMSFKAEGGAGNELSAGNGMTVVKGGTVMIN
jgi:Rhs element Vgr protein